MTDLDVALTPAQWEHWDRHGWTLTAAPTEPCRTSSCNVPELGDTCAECHPSGVIPVPVTEPCPVCRGSRIDYAVTADGYVSFTCGHCSGSGVVPRTVGIIRPGRECKCKWDRIGCRTHDPMTCTFIPAERVGTATVTAVPVVDVGDAPPDVPHVVVSGVTGTVWWCGGERVGSGRGSTVWTDVQQVQVLFATPPNPGTTVWRLDKENQ